MRNRNNIQFHTYDGTLSSFIENYPFYYAYLRGFRGYSNEEIEIYKVGDTTRSLRLWNTTASSPANKITRQWMKDNGLGHFIK